MRRLSDLIDVVRRPSRATRTVRLRLTAVYGGLFLVSGAGLLAITYVLVYHATAGSFEARTIAPTRTPGGPPSWVARSHAADLHQLVVQSGIALAIMTAVSAALGWLVAGRVLAPLRTMTAATRRITEENLHDRLALPGPDDELTGLADTIDGLLERLEAAFDAQRRFVANASHELRTPLAMMRTSLDVAVAKPEPISPQLRALDAKLREGLDQADRLLESFLMLARAQHGTLANQTSVSLTRIVEAALRSHGDAITENDIHVQTSLAPMCVAGSETLLARMIENVIENAARHNEPHGFMSIVSEIAGGAARLVVESGGPRLDERSVEQLVQPFQRLGAERTGSDDGVGLGLSIVAAVAAAHDGALELHARSEGGLRVQIVLPGATLSQAAPVSV